MNSSGIKRGLAGSAITALAITGLPFLATSASAATVDDDVQLISQNGLDASVKNDGQNNTIRLEAVVTNPANPVTFQYNTGNPDQWVTIATVTANDDGYASYEWAAANLIGATVDLRALVTEAGEESTSVEQDVTIFGGGAAAESVNVTDGSALGVFQEPYSEVAGSERNVVVDGTTSATDGAVGVYWYDETAAELAGNTEAGKTNVTDATVTQPEGSSTGVFSGVLDIDGYNFSGATDNIAIGAQTGQTDDVEGFTLYNQTITEVTAEPTSGTVAGNGTREITVTVTDQNGEPVAGAEVRASADQNPNDAEGAFVGYTNGDGQVTVEQGGGTTVYYYANATDSNPYEPGLGDERTQDVTVGQYNPEADSLEATSANGVAFDYDEYDPDDIQVQVQDQQGADFGGAGQIVEYYWVFSAFDGTPSNDRIPDSDTDTTLTDANGQADIPLPEQTEGGTYTLFAGVQADPLSGQGAVPVTEQLTVSAGQAEITFDESSESAVAGSEEEVAGTLALEDGTGLAGRPILLTYAADGAGDAAFDQATGADQDTRTVTTGADGSFSATLDDPAEDDQTTETGTVTAATQSYEDPNTPLDPDNADAAATQDVTFFQNDAPADSTVVIDGEIAAAGQESRPGEPVDGTVTVTSPDGADEGTARDVVANQVVTLTVDGDSFFTDGYQDDTTGEEAGDLTDLGQEITVVTNDQGVASFSVGIERSEDFDDNGLAEDIVTATINTDTDTEDVDYTSSNPLNGGEVLIDFAADRFQESSVLPLAPTTDDVAYDVKVTDQFGNLVGDEDVTITSDGGAEVVDGNGGAQPQPVEADFDAAPEFFLSSDEAANATPTGTWMANESLYAAGGEVATTENTDTVTGDGPTAQFYEVDFANSTYTLSQNGAENQPVGSTVIMTYTAVDQNGEPIEFSVDFFRTGPDDQQGGEANSQDVPTGEDGKASYVFAGTAEGTATVTAIGSVNGEVVPESQVTDTVTFGPGEPEGPNDPDAPIVINISGDDNGGAKDVVRALVTNGEAETIKLFKIRGKVKDGNRRLKQVREDVVPEGGNMTFKVADRNGNKKTRFIAKIQRDAQDGPENFKSNTQKIR